MRTYDAGLVNSIANAPGVPELFGVEGFDFTAALERDANVFLECEGALAICEWSAPRVYQCHLIFPRTGLPRRAAIQAARMRDFMFANHADMLWGQPPIANAVARKLIRQIGFIHAGFGENELVGPVEYLTCRR